MSIRNDIMSYREQKEWKELQEILPKKFHFTNDYKPTEEWWDWKGHKVHLDCFRNKNAKAKVILLHGVGTNGRQLSMIIGGPLAKAGFETIAIDMPTYGMTKVKKGALVTYDDWVDLASDYINYELGLDKRPIVLYGLSAGGMETYHVACKNKKVKGIVGMTFLDQNSQQVRNETTNNKFMSAVGVPMTKLCSNIGLSRFKLKLTKNNWEKPSCFFILMNSIKLGRETNRKYNYYSVNKLYIFKIKERIWRYEKNRIFTYI